MNQTAENVIPQQEAAKTPLRFVTAASLFDGHDAAINIMRRLIQAQGAEVIHLGHNRSVLDIVRAAIQEDADAIAVSSYQGGHNEYFRYMIDMLKELGAGHIQVAQVDPLFPPVPNLAGNRERLLVVLEGPPRLTEFKVGTP